MKKQHYAFLFAASAMALTLFAERAAAPAHTARSAKGDTDKIVGRTAERGIPYVFPAGRTPESGREVHENGYRGIEFSLNEPGSSSTGYVHPYYRHTPVEIVPPETGN